MANSQDETSLRNKDRKISEIHEDQDLKRIADILEEINLSRADEDPLAVFRGMFFGAIVSSILWIGIFWLIL